MNEGNRPYEELQPTRLHSATTWRHQVIHTRNTAIAMNALLKREIILFVNDGRRACLKLAKRGFSDFIEVNKKMQMTYSQR